MWRFAESVIAFRLHFAAFMMVLLDYGEPALGVTTFGKKLKIFLIGCRECVVAMDDLDTLHLLALSM